MYRYAIAEEALLMREDALGIEVTDPRLARLCRLGTIDPQHGPGAAAAAPAAIEVCLEAPLPPHGALLVTTRPDLDSIGAMALLTLRSRGRVPDAALRGRASRIAAIDRFDRGPWPGRRPQPETADDIAADGIGAEMGALAAAASERQTPLAERVATLGAWLVDGSPPRRHADAAQRRAEALLSSLREEETRVWLAADERIAVVVSPVPGALGLAYRLAPVVTALNPDHRFAEGESGAKYTIACWAEGDADFDVAAARLAALEPGWGGQRRIRGSPQDQPSALLLETVVQAVAASLPAGDEGNPP